MATKTTVRLIDDTDGSEAVGTVEFGLDGKRYEIDLSEQNEADLREALAIFVAHARRVGGPARTTAPRKAGPSGSSDASSARQWLRENGHTVGDKGRIPAPLMALWRQGPGDGVVGAAPATDVPEKPAETALPAEEAPADDTTPAVLDDSDEAVMAWHRFKGYKVPTDGKVNGLMRSRYQKAHAATA